MTSFGVVVPATPPLPPKLTLLDSAVKIVEGADPSGLVFEVSGEQLAMLPADLKAELKARQGESWVRGLTFAPEGHWGGEVRDKCDTTSIDLPPLPAPLELEGKAKAGGGTVPAEALEYAVTAVNANGETTASAILKITPGAEGVVVLTWHKVSDTAEYRVYRCKGGVKKPLRIKGALVPSPASAEATETVTYTDTGEATEAGKETPTSNTTGGAGQYTNLANVDYVPFLVEAEDYCSTFGFEERDFKGRALRLLDNVTPGRVEKEFWSGALAQAHGYPNKYLTKEGVATNLTPGTVPSVSRGLQILQDALAECGFGGVGMIHTQRQTTTNLLTVIESDPHFTVSNGRLYDLFGNIVVPGVGYPGNLGPESSGKVEAKAGNAFMFATDLVMCRTEKDGTIFTETFAEATDWGQGANPNSIRMRAQRFAAAYADFACAFAVEVELQK
jgi:hypothetical protein